MNEQIEQTVNQLLIQSIQALSDGAEWLAGEIPEVIEQLLMWNLVQSLFSTIIAWLALILITIASIKITTKARKDRHSGENWTKFSPNSNLTSTDYDFLSVAPIFISAIAWVSIVTVYVLGGGLTWLKILVAPKLYLLEYAADLVK